LTIAWGMDSVMLNEWPSKFYHPDLDDVDTISVPYLADIAIAAATAGHMLYTEPLGSRVLEYYRNYVKSWYQIESLKKGVDVSPLSKMINQWETAQKMHELETPISSRFMYRVLGRELYMRIRNIRGAHSYLSVYAPLAYLNEVENFDKLFSLENLLSWSREEEEIINEAWSILVGELG
ncbi:MAG: peptidase, partial [Desulfurococcaceae archaeon]